MGVVPASIWSDPKPASLSNDARQVLLYSLTSQFLDCLGFIHVSTLSLASHLYGGDVDDDLDLLRYVRTIRNARAEVSDAGILTFHSETEWAWFKEYGPRHILSRQERDRAALRVPRALPFFREALKASDVRLAPEGGGASTWRDGRFVRRYPGNWSELRERVFERDHGFCQYCETQLSRDDFTVDHRTAARNGGSDDLTNLVLSCRSCNCTKGAS